MSAVSGLTSKGENKSKQKYQSLNINNLYKGKSLENPKTAVAPKHGLQTLGKVGAGRRMPPPANLPSLKSQTTNNPNITLVPTGGQGWGSGKEEESGATPPLQTSSTGPEISQTIAQKSGVIQSNPSVTSSMVTTDSNVGGIAVGLGSAASAAQSKTWSTITASAEHPESGPEKNYSALTSPFFPQEFPKLDGGNAPQEGTVKVAVDTCYGPGPSLRPQTEGSWGRGTLPQPGLSQNANQPPNAGNGGIGQPSSPPIAANDQNIQMSRSGLYPQPATGLPQQRPPMSGSVPIIPTGNQTAPPLMPGQTPMNYQNQYRMMTPFPPHMAYSRGAYPAGAYPPQGFAPPPPHGHMSQRQPYYSDGRGNQRLDDDSGGRQSRPAPPIITDKDLKGFDEILGNDVQSGWAAADSAIDYNAKLVFSDDEDSHGVDQEMNPKRDDKYKERRDYDRDERQKYGSHQRQWPANARPNNFEHTQQHPSQSAQFPRQPIHSNYSHSRYNRSDPMVADDDEMWRLRSREQEDEMAAAVIRARQRREEEEKRMERSRQAAHEKLKALEAKSGDKDKEFDQCSRHSSESKDEKQSLRDSRDTRPSNYNAFAVSKQYPKNVPPRFQKQQEMMRQTHQQSSGQSSHSPPYDQRYAHSSNRLSSESDSRDLRNIANNSQPPNKPPLIVDTSRSNSQISSGHESYDSERERRTPEYDLRDRRQRSSHSGSESNNWRAVQTQRHPINDTKDSSDHSLSRLSQDKEIGKSLQRDVPKKGSEENDLFVRKNSSDLKDSEPIVSLLGNKDNLSDKKVERQESSHLDKRNKEDRYTGRTDWATECESFMSLSAGPKREHIRHRPIPITQKQFESITEPSKKNFVSLTKKTNVSIVSSSAEDLKNSFAERTKDMSRKSATPELNQTASYTETVSQSKTNTESLKVQSIDDKNVTEINVKRDTERERDSKKDYLKDDKTSRKSHSNRYSDSIPNRGRNYLLAQPFRGRGREYRRSRGPNDKQSEPKMTSNDGNSRNKMTKSRRKSNSDESCVSEDINKKDNKQEIEKSLSNSLSGHKDSKPDDDRHTDRSSTGDTVMSGSASATNVGNHRGDPSRRGRGVVAFRNSNTRGLPRVYGPSNYGPPPSRAAFGDGMTPKSDDNRSYDQNRNEKSFETKNSNQRLNYKSNKEDFNVNTNSGQHMNQIQDNNRNSISNARKTGVSSNRSAGNATNSGNAGNRSDQLPPRFQKRNTRGSQARGPRNRDSKERSGSSNHLESDVTNNEEWETASESSDVADRSDRRTHKRSNMSEQRNDSRNHNRRTDNRRGDYPRGPQSNSSGNQSSGYRGGRNRNQGNNSSTFRSANPNQQRNGPIGGSNINDNNITVCALSDVTLDNPNAVEEALSDLKIRNKTSEDLIDDQLNSEAEDGFQTVSYKKRNRLNQGNESKKFKQEMSPKSKAVRNRQSKLAPRFAKQKETIRLNTISNEAFTSTAKLTEDMKTLSVEQKIETTVKCPTSDKTDPMANPKTVVHNAWAKPLSISANTSTSNKVITTTTKTSTNTTNSASHDIQALSVSSKSSSFDQHDSGIDVSDQPPSTASSQRSSPANDDNKLVTTTAKVNCADTRTDMVTDMDSGKPMCTVIFENTRYKEENKVLAKIGPSKSPSAVKDVFVGNTSVTNNVVTETSRPTQPISAPKKNESIRIEEYPMNEKNVSTNVAKVVGMQRTSALPTESDLNMKIASTKKVWESPAMTSITSAIESSNDNSKSVLLNTFEENKIMSNESHSNDVIHSVKEPEHSVPKVHYTAVDAITSLKTTPQPMTYSTPTPNQMSTHSYVSSHQSQQSMISSQQILLNTISSPPLAETLRPLSAVQQQYSVHNMATNPAISTPPTMLYNTHVAAHNVYQTFGQQIDNLHQTQLPAVMAHQFGPQHSSGHYGQHLLHQQHQQNQLNQASLLMAHQLAQPSASDQFKQQYNAVAHQQSIAKSLLNNQFVHQNNSTLQQTLSQPQSWATPAAHNQNNNQTANYYPQSSSVNSGLQAHQQHFAFQSQPSFGLLSAQPSQATAAYVQQSYRGNPQTMGRNPGVDAANPMAANLRSMFAGNMINDMKIATSMNQSMDRNRTSFTYSQSSGLQQLQQQQQHQLFANQKFTQRAILPIYAQQMLGQAVTGRPNSASNVNASNTYTTPIQRPKLNHQRSNQSFLKTVHTTHHQMPPHIAPQQPLQQTPVPPHGQLSTAQQAKMRQEAVRQTQSFFAQSSHTSAKNESQLESQSCAEVSNESLAKDCVIASDNISGLKEDNKITSIDKND